MKNLLYLILITPLFLFSQNNCSLSTSYNETNLLIGTNQFKCDGSFVFEFVVEVMPADTPYSVLLYKNGDLYEFGTFSSINSQTPSIFVFDSLLYAGDYDLRVITSSNDTCYESFSFVDPPVLEYEIDIQNPVSCDTEGVVTIFNINGGSPPFDVGISESNGFNPIYYTDLSQDFFYVDSLEPGFYSFTIRDVNDCLTTIGDDVPIEISQGIMPMELNYSLDNGVNVCVDGGVSPYQFVLDGDTINSSDNCITYELCGGNYEVIVLDSYDMKVCSDTTNFDIEVIDASIDQLTKEAVINSGGLSPFSYSWSLNGSLVDGENDAIYKAQFCEGNYSCLIMDRIGCQKTVSLTINPLVLNLTKDLDCMDQEFNVLEVNPEGGTEPYELSWNQEGEFSSTISNLSPKVYEAYVRDYHNCFAQDQVEIPVLTDSCLFNAFSPNGDLINDIWKINSSFLYENSEVMIYNRWGKQIFHSLGYKNGWDGLNSFQNEVAEGVYFYVIDLKNGSKQLKGSVSVFR